MVVRTEWDSEHATEVQHQVQAEKRKDYLAFVKC